jgi:hypothetical protein
MEPIRSKWRLPFLSCGSDDSTLSLASESFWCQTANRFLSLHAGSFQDGIRPRGVARFNQQVDVAHLANGNISEGYQG